MLQVYNNSTYSVNMLLWLPFFQKRLTLNKYNHSVLELCTNCNSTSRNVAAVMVIRSLDMPSAIMQSMQLDTFAVDISMAPPQVTGRYDNNTIHPSTSALLLTTAVLVTWDECSLSHEGAALENTKACVTK